MAQGGPGLKQEGKTGIRRDNSLDLGVGENLLNEAGAHLITWWCFLLNYLKNIKLLKIIKNAEEQRQASSNRL